MITATATKTFVNRAMLSFIAASTLLLSASTAYAHSGSLNKIAVDVCKQKQKSQSCQYEGGHNDLYIGTCQYISDTDLICVRNKPIQKIDSSDSHNTDSEKEHKH